MTASTAIVLDTDFDADGDGFDASPWSDDCDDGDAQTYPGAEEIDDGIDQDCDGMRDEDFVAVGDLVITELAIDPLFGEPGQYVELLNTAEETIDLTGMTVWLSTPESLDELSIAPSAVVVLCADADPIANGGITCDLEFDGLLPKTGVFAIQGDRTLDKVDWSAWSPPEDEVWELAIEAQDAASNDDRDAWCVVAAGSPGTVESHCAEE